MQDECIKQSRPFPSQIRELSTRSVKSAAGKRGFDDIQEA